MVNDSTDDWTTQMISEFTVIIAWVGGLPVVTRKVTIFPHLML